jgi:hypothetical protein
VFHDHDFDLRQVPAGERVFFAVRDPVERFVSGFISRQRCGRPRYDIPWTEPETRAFSSFASADSLARALTSDDDDTRFGARTAMMSIQHVRDSYWRWFHDLDYFDSRVDDILLIMSFATLELAFAQLCALLALPTRIVLPTDAVSAHRNPVTADRRLSDAAVTNLKGWYGSDFAFIDICARLSCFAPAPER